MLFAQCKTLFSFLWPPLFPPFTLYFRSPALIGCFVVDRKYFEEIGLLDEGMEIYGGENVELGIRVSRLKNLYLISHGIHISAPQHTALHILKYLLHNVICVL